MVYTMLKLCRIKWVVLAFVVGLSVAKSVSKDPELLLINKERYHGELRPGETVVDLDPPLKTTGKGDGKNICGYTLERTHKDIVDDVPLPFAVKLRDHATGAADLVLAKGAKLNGQTKPYYKFWVSAYDCGQPRRFSESVHVKVSIIEDNIHPPVFEQQSYTVSVQEGLLFDKILQVTARDEDLSPRNHDICRYNILTPDVPFVVDEEGNVKNTEKLEHARKNTYILAVVAQDCAGKRSKPIGVTVKVMPTCRPGWNGIDERLEYTPNSGVYKMLGSAQLDTCNAVCKVTQVSAKVTLQTKHIGKGCDRDTHDVNSQRKICGATEHSIDLLPSPDKSNSWTKSMPNDDGKMSDQIFAFDGKTTAVEVDSKKVNHTLGAHFTISTWMKHEQDVEDDAARGRKEQIMCSSDADKMNRHHYSWFVHNCRLVLLVRQEPGSGDPETYRHAEWRWKLPQVCDGEWHHYAVSVNFPKVNLFIDGTLFKEERSNPEILDDWALHASRKVHGTKLVVGACWLGGTGKMSQHFRGYLAGLTMLKGAVESTKVLKCMNHCQEKLDFRAMSQLHGGMSASFNHEMTEISVTSNSVEEIQRLVREIGYVNSRLNPTPGRRNIKVETQFKCAGDDKLTISPLESYVMVLQSSEPVITIQGVPTLTANLQQLIEGVVIFPDLTIVAKTKAVEEEDDDEETVAEKPHKLLTGLDECVITTATMEKREGFIIPETLAKSLGLFVEETKNGLTISGADKVFSFEKFIRNLGYYSNNPKNFIGRQFKLVCSEQNGRFVSNEFKTQIDVLVREPVVKEEVHVAHVQDHKQNLVMNNILPIDSHELHLEEEKNDGQSESKVAGTSAGIVAIVIVCVGFLIFMIVLGVIRIRAAHQRTQVVTVEEQQEMEWDDNWDNSPLNITVNPLENNLHEEFEMDHLQGDDSDSDDDGNSIALDDLESSEDESEKIKDRDLEWDDSTLEF